MKYCCDYTKHYVSQSGGAQIPVFYGRKIQSGHGLGAMFSALGRMAMPLIRPFMPHITLAAKYLGKKALATGSNIVGDVIAGRNIKQSAADRFKETGLNVLSDVATRLQTGSGKKKRKPRNKTSTKKIAKKKRKIEKTIFD
jgi:hypothetical protein